MAPAKLIDGRYQIDASATDGAGNVGTGQKIFNDAQCKGRFHFTVNRSNITSDGAFMYDRTVVVKLVRDSDNVVVKEHAYGSETLRILCK